ncbi:MAG: VCBS repeat-containing protein [Deltaproteobacteria bacterium]|nr:VCBS repeat-containing protein [Deltaproteobacteria bacterium]
MLGLAGCNQLLGISNPVAGDATAPDGPRPDGPMDPDAALDAPPACTTSHAFGGEITSAVGGTGVAMVVSDFSPNAERDVAVAITTDTVIMEGDNAGTFTATQSLTEPATFLVAEDYDLIGARKDLVLLTATTAVVRQQIETGAQGQFTAAAQPLTGPFAGASGLGTSEYGGNLVSDVVITDDSGVTPFISIAAAGTFNRGTSVGAAGDKLVFAGQIDKENDSDVLVVDAAGNVKLVRSNGADGFDAPTTVATGATGLGVGVGKFDDDTFLDIVVATATGGEIYLQNSASPGVFTKQTGTFGGILSTVPLLIGDVNADGLDDVVTPTAVVMQCPTTRVFTQVEELDATQAVLADVNGNAKLDLLRLTGTNLVVRLQ